MFYLDTSVIAPAFVREARSDAILDWLSQQSNDALHLSAWAAAELVSIMGRRVRQSEMSSRDADDMLAAFDHWRNDNCVPLGVGKEDIERAAMLTRHYESGLRAADALHLSLAERHSGLVLLTYDEGLLKAAQIFGLRAEYGPM